MAYNFQDCIGAIYKTHVTVYTNLTGMGWCWSQFLGRLVVGLSQKFDALGHEKWTHREDNPGLWSTFWNSAIPRQ